MSYTQQSPPTGQYGGDGPSGPRAGFWIRFGSLILDGIIVGIPFVILFIALKGVGYALGLALEIGYYVYFIGSPGGQTLAMKATGIRIIDKDTGGSIGYGRAFIRWIGGIISSIPLYLGYLWMLWDREKQGWMDKMANDVVVPVSAYPPPS
jgi:uncharacterized RDD family membrane protein YckC